MTTYTASNGTTLTDDDVERWAQEAEAGFPNSALDASAPAPWLKTDPMESHSSGCRVADLGVEGRRGAAQYAA